MIYLDNSATTYPKPLQVRRQMVQALQEFGANPSRSGYEMGLRTTQKLYDLRCEAAEFFGASGPECIIFQPGCTQALNVVLKGFLKPGDHVLVTDLEHNAVMRPLAVLEEKEIAYTMVEVFPGDNDATVDSFRKAIKPNTRLAVCTQASNVFGVRVPVERIAALCHQYDIKICVDGAQSAGVLPINVQEDGLDFLCVAGHKGLYGPMGTGLLILRDPSVPLATLVEGGTGTQSRSLLQPDDPPERFESGTQNVPGLLGLYAGLNFVRQQGVQRIYREEMEKVAYLYERLSKIPEVQLYTARPEAPYFVPVLSFNLQGQPCEKVGKWLGKNGIAVRTGLHCAPLAHEKMGTQEGTIRLSPSVFTQKTELDQFILKLLQYVKQEKNKGISE